MPRIKFVLIQIIPIKFYILTSRRNKHKMILGVLFCAQHAAVANCEGTVGDNMRVLNVLFSFNDRFMERKKAFPPPVHGTKIGVNSSLASHTG